MFMFPSFMFWISSPLILDHRVNLPLSSNPRKICVRRFPVLCGDLDGSPVSRLTCFDSLHLHALTYPKVLAVISSPWAQRLLLTQISSCPPKKKNQRNINLLSNISNVNYQCEHFKTCCFSHVSYKSKKCLWVSVAARSSHHQQNLFPLSPSAAWLRACISHSSYFFKPWLSNMLRGFNICQKPISPRLHWFLQTLHSGKPSENVSFLFIANDIIQNIIWIYYLLNDLKKSAKPVL